MKVDVAPVPKREEHLQQLGRVSGYLLARVIAGSTAGWIAIAAAVFAAAAPASRGSRLEAPALGARRKSCSAAARSADVVDFAVSLQDRIDDLHAAVDEVAAATRARRPAHRRLARASIVRYDAYGGTAATSRRRWRILDSAGPGSS